MPPIPAHYWHSLVTRHAKSLKAAFTKVSKALDAQLSAQAQARFVPILVRSGPNQPLHPVARIRQNQSRWFSTVRSTVRQFSSQSGKSTARFDRVAFNTTSKVGSHLRHSSGRVPFASTLRPSLTGGTLGRTAGGYTLGSGRIGGARHFSHGPACQAQVVQNVSQAVRAFFISGQKAQFDGVSPHTGEKRYKAVSALREETGRKLQSVPRATPGSWIEFQINPTITALTPLSAVTGYSVSEQANVDHLNTYGLIDGLSADFSRALKDLAAVLNDIQILRGLGDLPITCDGGTHLRVHFPGCDAETVNILCDELNIRRGVVVQDETFDAFAGTDIALLFPFAPSQEPSECDSLFEEPIPYHKRQPQLVHLDDLLSTSEEDMVYSTQSARSESSPEDVLAENPWLSDPSGYESVHSTSDYGGDSDSHSPLEYQGFEGLYRYIEMCDTARR